MKIYTRTGDDGTTGLFGGQRVPKDHVRVTAYGAVDELNATLGLAVAALGGMPPAHQLLRLQGELFVLGADLATPADVASRALVRLDAAPITVLEQEMDAWEAELPELTSFILPGGTPAAAQLHHARTVCRRAERATIGLARSVAIGDIPLIYLNRLSDWLFVAARWTNLQAGVADTPWLSPRQAG